MFVLDKSEEKFTKQNHLINFPDTNPAAPKMRSGQSRHRLETLVFAYKPFHL